MTRSKRENPRKLIPLFVVAAFCCVIQSCSSLVDLLGVTVTRTEEETFTVTERDTTLTHYEKDAPLSQDNGIVSPSPKVIQKDRYVRQKDSVVERFYPDFIRLGLFESVGLLGGDTDFSLNSGPLGVHVPISQLTSFRGDEDKSIFAGSMFRFGIMEYRLRWFEDAENWTIGTHAFEAILPTARLEDGVMGVFPIYLRKRFYFSESIPNLSATLSAGFSYFPSQYGNISASLDLGSMGGTNFRFYLGTVVGRNPVTSPVISANEFAEEPTTIFAPYAGLGISLLDFVNTVPETYTEWKDHEHSAWNIGLLELGILNTNSDQIGYGQETNLAIDPAEQSESFINGVFLKALNADLAIPVLDNGFYAGTSLLSLWAFSTTEMSVGILPLRVGYNKQILADELFISPFLEWSYYPSNTFNIGARMNLQFFEYTSVSLLGGYASGNTADLVGTNILGEIEDELEFGIFYLGFSFNISTQHFKPEVLRYNK